MPTPPENLLVNIAKYGFLGTASLSTHTAEQFSPTPAYRTVGTLGFGRRTTVLDSELNLRVFEHPIGTHWANGDLLTDVLLGPGSMHTIESPNLGDQVFGGFLALFTLGQAQTPKIVIKVEASMCGLR